MKQTFATLILLLIIFSQVKAQKISTRGIVGESYRVDEITNDLFGGKEKRYDKARNERLRQQNRRLEGQVYDLEVELDDCIADRNRRRYSKRRYNRNFDLQQNYWGERRIEKEYKELREENVFLRDYRDWLVEELDDCQRSYNRDRNDRRKRDYRDRDYRDRDYRDRDYRDDDCKERNHRDRRDYGSCSCHKGKGKGKEKPKHHPHCKYGKHGKYGHK